MRERRHAEAGPGPGCCCMLACCLMPSRWCPAACPLAPCVVKLPPCPARACWVQAMNAEIVVTFEATTEVGWGGVGKVVGQQNGRLWMRASAASRRLPETLHVCELTLRGIASVVTQYNGGARMGLACARPRPPPCRLATPSLRGSRTWRRRSTGAKRAPTPPPSQGPRACTSTPALSPRQRRKSRHAPLPCRAAQRRP